MIGVNVSGNDAEKLKEVMDKEKLNWRSFADPGDLGQGAIAAKWNLAATPTLYVIDQWRDPAQVGGQPRRAGHRRGAEHLDQGGGGEQREYA